jgi:hypothetical protein
MTDIIEVAKLCGRLENGTMYENALQAFADHYRKEGAEEANNTIAELEAELIGEKDSYLILHNVNEALHAKLAATELVAEQMREALDKSDSYIRSTDSGGFSALPVIKNNKAVLQLHPSLSVLREHEAKVLEDAADKFTEETANALCYLASELRAKGEE